MAERFVFINRGINTADQLLAIESGITKRTVQRMTAASIALTRAIRREARGGTLKGGRGKLAQSWKEFPVRIRGGNQVEGGSASDSPYADIQDRGGDIRPKTAGALTIPLTDEARRRRAGDYVDLFIYRSPLGKAFLARQLKRSGGRSTLELVYMLTKLVTLKGTGYITKAEKNAAPEILDLMDQAVQDELLAFARKN